MKNIALGILVLFCLLHGLTVIPGVKGRRLRREQPACKSYIIYEAPLLSKLHEREQVYIGLET